MGNTRVNNTPSDEEMVDEEMEQVTRAKKRARSSDVYPLHGLLPLYRTLNDSVASIIVSAKSEGASKFEIGKHIGYNVHTKVSLAVG